jgi:hypothetical protein
LNIGHSGDRVGNEIMERSKGRRDASAEALNVGQALQREEESAASRLEDASAYCAFRGDRAAGCADVVPTGPECDMPPVRTHIVEDSPIILDNLMAALEELTPVEVVGSAADEDAQCLGVLACTAEAGVAGRRVVLTKYATADLRWHCRQLGADRVFDKSREVEEPIAYCARVGEGGRETASDDPDAQRLADSG